VRRTRSRYQRTGVCGVTINPRRSRREHPAERGEQGAIGRPERRPRRLTTKHRELMAQNEQFSSTSLANSLWLPRTSNRNNVENASYAKERTVHRCFRTARLTASRAGTQF
jgi:hypothetical protein